MTTPSQLPPSIASGRGLEMTALALKPNELLMLFWHAAERRWWATVSPQDRDDVRFLGEGHSPIEALAKLLIEVEAVRGRGGAS